MKRDPSSMTWVRQVGWLVLFSAFCGAALVIRTQMQKSGAAEIWGWDYQTFVGQIRDWRWIGYFGFRHPGLGLVCSPLVALEHVWSGAYLVVMPAVATVTAWMIWRMAGLVGLAVWLAFPTTWLMAGVPESFPIAQLALVGSAYFLLCEEDHVMRWGRRVPFLISGAFAILNAAITLTNGVKPLLGCLVWQRKRLNRKMLARGGLAVLGLALLGVGFFYLRTVMTGRGMGAGLAATLSWIPEKRSLPQELYGFFIRPIGLWQSLVIYPLAFWGLFRGQTLLLSYFAVDVVIHLVIGWGMKEPWVFAPHWIWILPIVIGRGMRKCCVLMRRGVLHGDPARTRC